MASNTIIQKLNDHVAQGLNKESDVTYVLVQLVKLLERQKSKPTFPALTFYRNWAVHEKLASVKSNQEMKVILDDFEAVLQQASQGGADVQTLAQGLADSISLNRLEADINAEFDSHAQFDRHAVGRPEAWPNFRCLLLGILADISLEAPGYKYVQELKVKDDGQFKTIVLIDQSGQTNDLPLT